MLNYKIATLPPPSLTSGKGFCFAILYIGALLTLFSQSVQADTYILNASNTTVNNPTIADDGDTKAIVSSGSTITYTKGTMTIVGDSTIDNTQRLELQAAIVADNPYTITKTNSGALLFMNDSSAVGKIVVQGGTVVSQNNVNSINAINGVELNSGTLQIWDLDGVNGTIYANGGILQSAGATQSGSETSRSNTFSGSIVLNKDLTIDVIDAYVSDKYITTSFITSGSITGTSQITKTGNSIWKITGAVSCGKVSVSGGEIVVAKGGSITGTQLMMKDGDSTGTYTFTVDGGRASFASTSNHVIGHYPNHTGVINLKSGSLNVSNEMNIGWDGTGKYYQSGGTATFATLNLIRSNSLLEFSAGTTTINTLNLGKRTTTNVYDSFNSVTFKGTNSSKIGNICTYRGGTVYIQDNASITTTGGAYFGQIDSSYTNTIYQSGGTFTIGTELALGHWGKTNAVYNISGGTLNVLKYSGNYGLWMAVDGDGTLNQSGGTVNVGRINLNARNDNTKGTYTMTGGTLNLGAGGLMATESGTSRYSISLSKGTITAGASSLNDGTTDSRGSWSSSLNMSLTGTGTNRVTFKPESGYSITLSGTLSGSGGLIKDGEGTLIFSRASSGNAYTGGTLVKSGTLKLLGTYNNGCRFNGEITINQGATLDCAAHDSLGYNGTQTKMYVYGTVDNSVGNETLKNMQINLYGGTVKSSGGGNLDILNDGVSFNSYALTDATAENPTISTISSKVNLRTSGTFNITTDENSQLNISGQIVTGENSCVVNKLGTGILELQANNTYNGGTTISKGMLRLTGNGTLGTGTIGIAAGATLEVNVANGSKKKITNQITGVTANNTTTYGNIRKTGAGTLQLDGTSKTIETENFVLESGRLDMKGFYKGNLEVEDGATLSPGNSIGTLTITDGTLTLNPNSILLLEVGKVDGNIVSDTLSIADDNVTYSTGAIIQLVLDSDNSYTPQNGDKIQLNIPDKLKDALSNNEVKLSSYYFKTYNNGTEGFYIGVDPNAVPEPSTWALLILGFAGLMWLKKRNERR